MTAREQRLALALLDVLHDRDGAQLSEVLLHAETNLRVSPNATLAEFNGVVHECDRRGWITGVPARHGTGNKWNINDAGEAARLELR